MPRLSPSAWRRAAPSASAAVFHRVVFVDVQVALALQGAARNRRARPAAPACDRRSHAGGDVDGSLGIQVQVRCRCCVSFVLRVQLRAPRQQFGGDCGPGLVGWIPRVCTRKPRTPRLRANSMSVVRSPTMALAARSTRARGKIILHQPELWLAAGAVIAPAGAGRCRPRRRSVPARPGCRTTKSCGESNRSRGKRGVPRPSWFVTITSRKPAAVSCCSDANTSGIKRILARLSTCSSGGSSISVPSRSTNRTLAAHRCSRSSQALQQAVVFFRRSHGDAQRSGQRTLAHVADDAGRRRATRASTSSGSLQSTSRKLASLGHTRVIPRFAASAGCKPLPLAQQALHACAHAPMRRLPQAAARPPPPSAR